MSGVEEEDLFIILCGPEGTCKTLLGIAVGVELDPKFCINRIVFTQDSRKKLLKELIISNAFYGAVILTDEPGAFMYHVLSKDNIKLKAFNAAAREFMFINLVCTQSLNLIPDSEHVFRRADALLYLERVPGSVDKRTVKMYLGEEWKGRLLNIRKVGRKWVFPSPDFVYRFSKNKLLNHKTIRDIFLSIKDKGKKKDYALKLLEDDEKDEDVENLNGVKLSTVRKSLNITKVSYDFLFEKSGVKAWKVGRRGNNKEGSWYTSPKELLKLLNWLVKPEVNMISGYAYDRACKKWKLKG